MHEIAVSTRHKDPIYYVSALRNAALTHRFIKLTGLEFAVVTLVDTILLHQQLHLEWKIASIRTDYKDITSKVTGKVVKKIYLEVILRLENSEEVISSPCLHDHLSTKATNMNIIKIICMIMFVPNLWNSNRSFITQ